uniref:Uncharacterized protein n=1 Tax=Cacopsylla melanoneura TaxID=428564 RepID=A0A8D8VIR3_9HEMI
MFLFIFPLETFATLKPPLNILLGQNLMMRLKFDLWAFPLVSYVIDIVLLIQNNQASFILLNGLMKIGENLDKIGILNWILSLLKPLLRTLTHDDLVLILKCKTSFSCTKLRFNADFEV